MGKEIVIPDYLKNVSIDHAKDMVTATGGAPRISIRGRQFRFIKDGEEIHKQTEPINVIILGVAPETHMAKTYYIEGYSPGSTDPPDCSSFFGIQPDDWVDSPQSDYCKNCEQNKWGSAESMTGKKAKACKDSKRLMVVNAKSIEDENPEIYIFNVTIASLKALSTYGKFLIQNQLPMCAVITQISFVDSEFPQVEFDFVSILKEEFGTKMIERSSKKEWLDGLDVPQLGAPNKPSPKTISHTVEDTVEAKSKTEVEKTPEEKSDDKSAEEILGKW